MSVSSLLAELPSGLQRELKDAELVPVEVGVSGAQVVEIRRNGLTQSYLKLRQQNSSAPPLRAEYERLLWLEGRIKVPRVQEYGSDEVAEWMVTSALPGVNGVSAEIAGDAEGLVRRFGEALKLFHVGLDVAACKFVASTDSLLATARHRVESGTVDTDEFQSVNTGVEPEELLSYLEGAQPTSGDLVVLHGDFSMPNVIFNQPEPPGYVDLGLCGIGDPYLDLAVGARSVARNLGGAAVGLFFEGYGIEWPDLARLDFYVNLQDLL